MDLRDPNVIGGLGAAAGFLGGIFLAFAAAAELRALRLAFTSLQTQIYAARNGDTLIIDGVDVHLDKGKCKNTVFTWTGIGLLFLSLTLTIASLWHPWTA